MTQTPSNDLTPSQLRMIKGLAEGKRPKQIAKEVGLTTNALHWHFYLAYRKLGAKTAAHAVSLAIKQQLI